MRTRSLASLLTRQWIIYGSALVAALLAASLLVLFLLEDALINRELSAVAQGLRQPGHRNRPLPDNFSVYPLAQVPLDIHAKLPFARAGTPFEMERPDGHYIHALPSTDRHGAPIVVVYDVTDVMQVVPHMGSGMAVGAGIAAAALLAALLMSRLLVRAFVRHGEALAAGFRLSGAPSALREAAAEQPVKEFRDLMELHAQVWESQRQAIASERETLAYLGHELRTPLQSASTSLSLLQHDHADRAALVRLARAVSRLNRASHAVLWLASDRKPDTSGRHDLVLVIGTIVEELQPTARALGRTFETILPATMPFSGPAEIAEIVVANLLINAIQHGSGTVAIRAGADEVSIGNPLSGGLPAPGFGLGLDIVRRLAVLLEWQLETGTTDGAHWCRIRIAEVVFP